MRGEFEEEEGKQGLYLHWEESNIGGKCMIKRGEAHTVWDQTQYPQRRRIGWCPDR